MIPARNSVGWFEIYVQDMARAVAFYQNTFQVTLQSLNTSEPELWVFPMQAELPGCPGALARMTGKDSGTGGTLIYFSCIDCAVEATRAVQYGGMLQKPKVSIGPYGFISLVYDTEGNLIGLPFPAVARPSQCNCGRQVPSQVQPGKEAGLAPLAPACGLSLRHRPSSTNSLNPLLILRKSADKPSGAGMLPASRSPTLLL